MKPIPSRLKIALLSAGLSGLVLVVFGAYAWITFYRARIAAVDREIKALSTRHPGLFAGRGNYERLESSLAFTFGENYTNEVFFVLRDGSNRILHKSSYLPVEVDMPLSTPVSPPAQTPSLQPVGGYNTEDSQPRSPESGPGRGRGGYGRGGPPPDVVFSSAEFVTVRKGGSAWRVGFLSGDGVRLTFGIGLADVYTEMRQVRVAFLATAPIALLLIASFGWMISGRALRPLGSIAMTAEAVTAHGLDRRIPESSESPEIRRVITLLNRMMDRLEASFRQATRFSADASHELKTPLAIMQGELELALQNAEPGSDQQRLCNSLMENVQRLKTITRSLLLLSQADSGALKLALEDLDITGELEELLEDARALSTGKNLHFEPQLERGLMLKADRPLLRMALFNLLSNAVKYNEPNGTVELLLQNAGDSISLLVTNAGPGIPSDERSKVFDRFYRARPRDSAPVEGLGLGLSLSREIVRAHHGNLQLLESKPGRTSFLLTLPKK